MQGRDENMKNMYVRRIMEIRDEYGYSNAKMAELCGMKPERLRRIIRNDSKPRVDTIADICSGMDMTLREFYESEIFASQTEKQSELMRLYMSLDPENKMLLLKIAEEIRQTQMSKLGK